MSNRYYQGPRTDHFDGERFFHPGLPPSDKSLGELLRWRLFGKRTQWPEHVPARTGVRPAERVAGLRITFIGHASLLVQTAGVNLLVDPVWSERASPFRRLGPRRRNPPAVPWEHLPPIDAVLVTHNHYDHLDTATLARLARGHGPRMLAPLGNDAVIRTSVPEARVETGDWWDKFQLGSGVWATIVPAYHWSSRWLGDRRMALWGGFVLDGPAGRVYCAGDTAYRGGAIFRAIRERCGPPAVAVLPIGAYDPRWFMATQHSSPEEAVRIADELGAGQLLGVHWGTFQLTDEPWDEPAQRLTAAAGHGMRVLAMRPGDVIEAPQPPAAAGGPE